MLRHPPPGMAGIRKCQISPLPALKRSGTEKFDCDQHTKQKLNGRRFGKFKQANTVTCEENDKTHENNLQSTFYRHLTLAQQNQSPKPSVVAFRGEDDASFLSEDERRRTDNSICRSSQRKPGFKNRLAEVFNPIGEPALMRAKTTTELLRRTSLLLNHNRKRSEGKLSLGSQSYGPEDEEKSSEHCSEICIDGPNLKSAKTLSKDFYHRNYSLSGQERQPHKVINRLRHLKNYKHCIILPDDPWKMRWDLFLLLGITFSSIVTPYQISFYQTEDFGWIMAETIIDCIFLVDMLLSFCSAYYNEVEEVIDSRRLIVCGYLKSWFFIDLISILPIQHFLSESSNVNSLGQLAKIPRIMRMAKIVEKRSLFSRKISKLLKTSTACDKVLTLASSSILMWHALSCFWFLIAKLDGFPEDCWVMWYGHRHEAPMQQYLASLYFIITTITTVGYGDVTAHTPYERIFCCILMVIGVVSYSMAISQITSIMTANDQRQTLLKQKLNILQHIRKDYEMSFELYLRLRQTIHHLHLNDNKDNQYLLNELPNKLRLELSNVLYQQEVRNIEFFRNKSPHFIASVAPLLKSIKIQKGEYIYLKGDPLDGIYFIKEGEVAHVITRDEADLVFYTTKQGDYFGECDFAESMDGEEATRKFTVKALSDMTALVLDKQDLYNIDMEFKKEIFMLFKRSKVLVRRLAHSASRAKLWLKDEGHSIGSLSSQNISLDTQRIEEEEEQQSNDSQYQDHEKDNESPMAMDTD